MADKTGDELGDDDLHELLRSVDDNSLDAAAQRRVERLCEQNPAARQARDELVSSKEVLGLAMSHLLREPVAEDLIQQVNDWQPPKRHSSKRPPLRAVAAAAFIAVLSATLGWQLALHRETGAAMHGDSWVQAVLDYQILYTRATLEGVETAPDGRQQTAQRLSQALGSDLEIPDLSRHGLQFKRGQVLAFNQQPVIQVVYLPGIGEPLAYCVSPQAGDDLAPVPGHDRGLDYVTWRKDGIARVLVAANSAAKLKTISDSLTASMIGG